MNNQLRNRIARLNGDGTLDTALDVQQGMNSFRQTRISSAFVQNDGKIIISGIFDTINDVPRVDFARINSDGTLDTSFNANVVPAVMTSGTTFGSKILFAPDGKMLIGGYFQGIGSNFRSSLAKIDQNGTLDLSFDPVIGRRAEANLVKVQPDGKILIGGEFTIVNNRRTRFLARLDSDGQIDPTFTVTAANIRSVTAIELQPDNKILVGGTFANSNNNLLNYFARLNTNGTVDNTFNVPVDQFVTAITLQPDGKIIIAGTFARVNTNTRTNIARLNANGTTDTSFTSLSFFSGSGTELNKVIVLPDGKLLVAGDFETVSSVPKISLLRLNADGTLDSSFSTDLHTTSGGGVSVSDMVVQPDGKIIVVGSLGNHSGTFRGLVRFNPDGSTDLSIPSTILPVQIFSVGLMDNGKILVGTSRQSSSSIFGLVRLNADGSRDNTLNIGTGANSSIHSFAKVSNNRIITVGSFTEFNEAARWSIAGVTLTSSALFDFDGDGRSDISVFRPSVGTWYMNRSTQGFNAVQFGAAEDLTAPADYDGDSKADTAVFRNGNWFIMQSSNGAFSSVSFGVAGDLPRPGDFDSDGKADVCVFRPSDGNWYRINSSNGQFTGAQFGANGDIPQIADFDGDGKADLTVFRPSNGSWYFLKSSTGEFEAVQFGISDDVPTAGDFDGDGKTDISVFRPSNGYWYRLNSSSRQFVGVQFGMAEDLPSAGDYDGDGKTDLAVFRPSTGGWFLLQSQTGFSGLQFGINGDEPVPSSFTQ